MEEERTNPNMLEKELQSARPISKNSEEPTLNYALARKEKSIWKRPLTYIIIGATILTLAGIGYALAERELHQKFSVPLGF